jgi:hypothetical protein
MVSSHAKMPRSHLNWSLRRVSSPVHGRMYEKQRRDGDPLVLVRVVVAVVVAVVLVEVIVLVLG